MGIEVVVDGLTKSFGSHVVWRDVSLSLPAGEVSVMLGPSGTGKTVFLKSLVGLVRPDRGRVLVDGIDTVSCSERQLKIVSNRQVGDDYDEIDERYYDELLRQKANYYVNVFVAINNINPACN